VHVRLVEIDGLDEVLIEREGAEAEDDPRGEETVR